MKIPPISARSQRALLWVSIILANVYGYAFIMMMKFVPLPSPALDAEHVLAFYAAANLKFKLGVVLMLITGGWFTTYTAVLAMQMLRDENGAPIWTCLFSFSALFQSFTLGYPPVAWATAAFTVDRLPELTLLIHEFGFMSYITPVAWYIFIMVSLAVICFSRKQDPENSAFPRWLGYVALFSGISAEFGAMAVIFKQGPFAWNGLFPFYIPVIGYALWIICQSITLFKAIGKQERAELAANAALASR